MSSTLPGLNSEAAILARLLNHSSSSWSDDSAKYLLSIQFDDRDLARMDELSQAARDGKLTPAEEAELDSYLHVAGVLAALQLKARKRLGLAIPSTPD